MYLQQVRIKSALMACFTILALASCLRARADLPPQVRADLLEQTIIQSVKERRVDDAMRAFDEYRGLGVSMPPPLLFLEAKVSSAVGQSRRAFASLEAFLAVAPRDGRQYQEALSLYDQYKTDAGRQAQADSLAASFAAATKAFDGASSAYKQGDFVVAESLLTQLIKSDQSDADTKARAKSMLEVVQADRQARTKAVVPQLIESLRQGMIRVPATRVTIDYPNGRTDGYFGSTEHVESKKVEVGEFLLSSRPLRFGDLGLACGLWAGFSVCSERLDDVVDIDNAKRFLFWLGQVDAKDLRLVSLAQWLAAASSGGKREYPWRSKGTRIPQKGESFYSIKESNCGTTTELGFADMGCLTELTSLGFAISYTTDIFGHGTTQTPDYAYVMDPEVIWELTWSPGYESCDHYCGFRLASAAPLKEAPESR